MKPSPAPDASEGIAVVVPTLDERENVVDLVRHLLAFDFREIIIADGGSTDGTAALVPANGRVNVIRAERGRGVQINAGIEACTMPIVLVLHADTRLPVGADAAIRAALRQPRMIGGCFRLDFDKRTPVLDLYALMSRLETPLTTFGDQAFFFRREAFLSVGMAPQWPILEDVELRRRLRAIGHFRKLAVSVTTSSRRFEARGRIVVQMVNAAVLLGHAVGIPIESLSRFHERHCGDCRIPAQRSRS